MKKLLLISAFLFSFAVVSPVHAAAWTDAIQNAIKSGDYAQIDVIGAKYPEAQGEIAMYLLQQSQNPALSQDARIKLFVAATPYVGQVPPADAGKAAAIIQAMVNLANNPAFRKSNPHDTAEIFAAAVSMTSQPNIVAQDPNFRNLVLANADDFLGDAPADVIKKLQEQVSLALQIGTPPPLGPRGTLLPSAR